MKDGRIELILNDEEDKIEAYCHGRTMHIEIEEPWAGDSIEGFGRTCSAYLNPTQAVQLLNWLNDVLKD